MAMKGRFPIRCTLQYLGQGDVVFKDSVKVMMVNYNSHEELDSGEQILVDMETKSNKEIMAHIRTILGKNEETFKKEEQGKKQYSHPAHFGPLKYCLWECICEVQGLVPCPALVPLPKEMRGKYKGAFKASAQD
ncbi:28S ribosomal protein S25, mitochondrial-like [Echinops telfairi]|uniref:28S ribosomal protein S25, mitochondrial-like n=1 Tax=Echinops telfairi TaxID=9371 RepID=A0AC55DEH9_ECHTE|nr:28S ribosomal protein S25, mitochondrial-like [Echinops telfairi]